MLPVQKAVENVGVVAVHDEHGDARLGGKSGGAELGLHTSRTSLGTRASRGGHEGLGQVVHAVNQGSIGVLAGVLVVKTITPESCFADGGTEPRISGGRSRA